MKAALYILTFIVSTNAFAQELTTEQEITLPDYLLAPSAEEIVTEIPENDLDTPRPFESFEDELEILLQNQQETLKLYKFTATIFVLNKTTNKVTNYSLKPGDIILHKSLEIEVLNCLHNYDSLPDNDYIFLNVKDQESRTAIYNGWMSRRLPGIKPFNHPTYVIRATSCKVEKELLLEEQPAEKPSEVPTSLEEIPAINDTPLPTTDIEAPSNEAPLQDIDLPDNIILLPDATEDPLGVLAQ
jgi:hypothetical protein